MKETPLKDLSSSVKSVTQEEAKNGKLIVKEATTSVAREETKNRDTPNNPVAKKASVVVPAIKAAVLKDLTPVIAVARDTSKTKKDEMVVIETKISTLTAVQVVDPPATLQARPPGASPAGGSPHPGYAYPPPHQTYPSVAPAAPYTAAQQMSGRFTRV
jgi:hypothetical protein